MRHLLSARIGVALGLLAGVTVGPSAQSLNPDFQIVSVSARPDFVSGGDVLIRVGVGQGIALTDARVTLNGTDVTTAFHAETGRHGLTGLVTGLRVGHNTIAVASPTRGGGARLDLTNHPIVGPVFSGPHEQPFICETTRFKLQSGDILGAPIDEHCSVRTRVDYYYRATSGGALKPLPAGPAPADLAHVTTLTGASVPYIVRIETGTINRGIYQIAILHNPGAESAPSPWNLPAGWNRRLVYTHGGGCVPGWYRQGSTTGGVVDDVMLRQGYAVAASSLNVGGNNCGDLLPSETLMMVKERFVEGYGMPMFTIGWGCSGGSYPQLQTADNYPGLLDGVIPCRTFPDMPFATVMTITDARLLNRYFGGQPSVAYTDAQKQAVAGFLSTATMVEVDRDGAGRVHVTEHCPEVLPKAMWYDAATNPKGARCDIYDHAINAYGRDPRTGHARRPLDNVGIQYGLAALNSGAISREQFLDLNARIGGFDQDGNVVPARSVADLDAVRAAYRTGRLTNTGGGLASVPIIDYRNYLDDAPNGDVHIRFHSFSLRARLMKANGQADNHIMIVEDNRYRGNTSSPVYAGLLTQMDRWLTALAQDTSADPVAVKMRRAKPADLVDACWTRDSSPRKIAEPQTRAADSECHRIYPTASYPREVAGAPLANDIIKCQLKPLDPADYSVSFTPDEMTRLRTIFSEGVCDWSKPGVEQQRLTGSWLRFGTAGS